MQAPGGDNAGPGSDILRPELMLEETFLEKTKAKGKIFELNFIWSQILISGRILPFDITSCGHISLD